ncbi:ion transport peptide-like isoform X1 [Hermetia illucens]|nr:ion transport peptide-like isoform X1 [Hermetia illucens]XP_037911748.1 ion transport peptide-like isoform X1 [Hermetia illucens]XP_037911756.1 ion transport peptide-like isoform X1 [Hermetia illucens]XP_037911767.1 ion transport peptide-like isoform X1 [Hermetia illucens]
MYSRNLMISVVLILALVPLIATLPRHSLSKRTPFFEIGCKGSYNSSLFSKLDRICDDCYNLFREVELLRLCKHQCFKTDYFKGCVDSLQLGDEIESLKLYIKALNGATPPS